MRTDEEVRAVLAQTEYYQQTGKLPAAESATMIAIYTWFLNQGPSPVADPQDLDIPQHVL